MVFATDGEYNDLNGVSPYIEFYKNADVLIFDAMYPTLEQTVEKENYGHSTAVIGIDIALSASVGKLILFHHDPERTDDQLEAILDQARAWLRANAPSVKCSLAQEGMRLAL